MTNKTFYAVINDYTARDENRFNTLEEAVAEAKRQTANDNDEFFVVQALSRVQAPMPEAEVTNLS